MTPYPMLDPKKIRARPLAERRDKMTISNIRQLTDFVPVIPDQDTMNDIDRLAARIVEARRNRKPVIWMTADHVTIRRGNQRYLLDLMQRNIVTHVAGNGAVPIHDVELALVGSTLEDVEYYLRDGRFGNWNETGVILNRAASIANTRGFGFGQVVGLLVANDIGFRFSFKDTSIFAGAYQMMVPATIHVLIGADIVHQHPEMDGAAVGAATYRDFLIFAHALTKLDGGVFLNLGTAVHGPEVFLKAASMAINVLAQDDETVRRRLENGRAPFERLTTAVFDLHDLGGWREEKAALFDWRRDKNATEDAEPMDARYYFRPAKTVLTRSIAALAERGESFYIRGDCGVTIPHLYRRIISRYPETA